MKRNDAIHNFGVLVIVVQPQVGPSEVNQVREISRIELTCPLEIVYGVSAATLTASPSIQLTRKPARYWVNSVEQEQVRRARDHNPNSPKKGATPAPGALPPNPASNEMQNLWPTVPEPMGVVFLFLVN